MEMSRRAPAIVAAATRTGGLRSRPTNSRDPRFNLKQFVGEDAQAIDRGGFDPQYDRAECDRETTVGFRERNLGRREIALGTNQHQDALGKMFATANPSFGGSMFRRIISQDFF